MQGIIILLAMCFGPIVISILWDRAEKRAAFRQQCREQARERYRKATGCEPLDTLNAGLYAAYQEIKHYV